MCGKDGGIILIRGACKGTLLGGKPQRKDIVKKGKRDRKINF